MAEYKTYILGEKDKEFWDEFISESSNGTIFHRFEWLKAAEEHSKMKLLPVAVYKGNTVVSLVPFFKSKKYGLRILLSPPNSCGIPFLGPVLNIPASNRYKYEQTYIDTIDHMIQFLEDKIGFDFLRIVHTPDIVDMRSYNWKKYYVQPSYTYSFNLTADKESIYNGFHSSTKNALKKAMSNKEIVISKDKKYSSEILSLVDKRYKTQNRKFKVNKYYFEKLMSSSLSDCIESIAIVHNECTIAGDITLTDRKNAYAWVGSVNRDVSLPGVGELVLWEKIKEYIDRGFSAYDIVGANTRHLRKHKAKYGAKLVSYFVVQKSSMRGSIALKAMDMIGKNGLNS